ncbi:MAG: hypothetical protein ACR2RE_02505, partial [Geminicoccaceae bacterium]
VDTGDGRFVGGVADGWETVYVTSPLPNTVWDCVIPPRPKIPVRVYKGLTKDPTDWEPSN